MAAPPGAGGRLPWQAAGTRALTRKSRRQRSRRARRGTSGGWRPHDALLERVIEDAPQLDALAQAAQRHLHLPHTRQVLGAVDIPQLVHVLDTLQLGLPAPDHPQNVGPLAPAQGRGRLLQQPGADFLLPVIRQAGMLLQPLAKLGDDLPRGQDAGPAGAEVIVQLAAAAAVAGLGLTTLFFRAIAKAVAVGTARRELAVPDVCPDGGDRPAVKGLQLVDRLLAAAQPLLVGPPYPVPLRVQARGHLGVGIARQPHGEGQAIPLRIPFVQGKWLLGVYALVSPGLPASVA